MIITKIFLSVAIYALSVVLCAILSVAAAETENPPTMRWKQTISELGGVHILLFAAALAGSAICWLWGV